MCCHATKLYAAKRPPWEKRWKRVTPSLFALYRRRSPTSIVMAVGRPSPGPRKKMRWDARIRPDQIRLFAQRALFLPTLATHQSDTITINFPKNHTPHIRIGIFSPERVNDATTCIGCIAFISSTFLILPITSADRRQRMSTAQPRRGRPGPAVTGKRSGSLTARRTSYPLHNQDVGTDRCLFSIE